MKQRILVISSHFSTGGAPQFTLNKIQLLKENCDIWCVEYDFLSPDFVVQRNAVINLLGDNFIPLYENKEKLISVIEEISPDLILIEEISETFIKEEILEKIYSKDRTWKIIETTHSSHNNSGVKRHLPDKFTFVSQYSLEMYKHLGVESTVIEYPIDKKDRDKTKSQNKLGLDPDKIHILNVGLFTSGKNQGYAFEIAKKVLNKNFQFHFVGNLAGNFQDYWRPIMDNKPENCTIWGERTDVSDFIESCDLFLFTSKFELNPLVIKEVLCYDIPILMFNLPTYCGNYNNELNCHFLNGDVNEDYVNLLKLLETNNGHYDFIEIGTSDFDTLIEDCDDFTTGISIEPIKYYLDRLPNKRNVNKVLAAMSDKEGFIDVYYIENDKIIEHNLPWWVRGSNSVNKPHPFTVKEIGEELYNEIVTIQRVPTITWNMIIDKYNISSIEYLKVDTEGHDHVILNQYLDICEKNPNLLAKKIKFEYHVEVSNLEEMDKVIKRFKGYNIQKVNSDIILTKNKIPRVIHQTYLTKNLPTELQSVVDKLKDMNPTFEHRLYDDNNCVEFIKNNYDDETLRLYLSINKNYGSARSDFFRYLLMYKEGGVYLDIKSCTISPLEETLLPTDEYLLTHWPGLDWSDELNYKFGEFQNWHIICKPNHPFLKKVIEDVSENIRKFKDGFGKSSVLRITGPIAYSKSIISLLDKHRIYTTDSPVREYLLSEELGLNYMETGKHHSHFYKSYSEDETIVKHKKGYVLYSNDKYFEISKSCIDSIRKWSDLPIYLYLMNSDKELDIENTYTINWKCDLETDEEMYKTVGSNFYINRGNRNIYRMLIERPNVVKDALEKYVETVAYIDSDSIATKYVDNIFSMYPNELDYPYFVEGVYDYLFYNGRGGAETKEDLTNTLENPVCELFSIDQKIRERYRQTGYFVAGRNTIDFLKEWSEMCKNKDILENNEWFAPYNEETILNCLLYKRKILDGLPAMYVNGTIDTIDKVYNVVGFTGYDNTIEDWVRIPSKKESLLFFHGEKNLETLNKMIKKLEEI